MSENAAPPPDYPPPYAPWGPALEVHVTVTTEAPEKPAEPRWDFSWLNFPTNAWTALLGFWPGTVWARVLNDVLIEQDASGAWTMAGAAIVVTGLRFYQVRTWTRRTLLWAAVLGCALSLPIFDGLVHVLTGGGR